MKNIKTLWMSVAEFFEQGDLVPFAIIISVYHYYKALDAAGDGWIAIPVAIIVDLIHFRTVRHAVRVRNFWSFAIAGLTTAMAIYYHYGFYSIAIDDNLDALLHALPIPIGIAVLAWLNETAGVSDEIASLMERVKEGAVALQESESRVKEGAIALQESESRVKEGAIALQESETDCQINFDNLQESERMRVGLQRDVKAMKDGDLNFNKFAWEMMGIVRTGKGRTQAEIALDYDVSETAVSRFKKSLNGGRPS